MNPHWHCIESGPQSGAVNMACDEHLASLLESGRGNPTLRLYRWNPWAVSLGRHQNEADIDRSRCVRDHIDIVRRPTGGRAILHAEELTYSVVMYAGRLSIMELYNEVSKALVSGLKLFGVDVEIQRSQPDFRSEYRQVSSVSCFASSARYEIEWKGRKLVGSAQRRYSGGEDEVVLQHGSILCGPAHRGLIQYIAGADDPAGDLLEEELRARTVDLSEICSGEIVLEDLASCIRQGFESEWGLTFSESVFSSHEHKEHLLA